jgi:hypothetical protein
MLCKQICLFGIADSPNVANHGDFDVVYDQGRSSLTYESLYGKSYFFQFERLDRPRIRGTGPRFSDEDAVRFAEKHADTNIRPNLTLGDYWKRRTAYTLVDVNEGICKLWTWGRIACVGDSVHAMPPQIGHGKFYAPLWGKSSNFIFLLMR